MNIVPEDIESQLQTDEQLLWWKRPKLCLSMRMALLDSSIVMIIFGIFAWLLLYNSNSSSLFAMGNIGLFLVFLAIVALVSFSSMCLKTWNAFFWQSPPYRRHTFYAITSQRVLIILHVPKTQAIVFSYLPSEIGEPVSRKLTEGAYILTFAAARQARIGNLGPFFTLPGSFYSIRDAKEVSALLEERRMQSAQIASL